MSPIQIPIQVLADPLAHDTRGRALTDLRMSVLDRCNFRCPYCMPADRFPVDHRFLPGAARMSLAEMLQMIEAFVAVGVRKLRITGGEPLLYRELLPLIGRTRERWPALDIALTTNGTRLAALAAGLQVAGLGRVTVSLDALDPQLFAQFSGGHGDVQAVLHAIECAQAAGLTVKINCVVLRSRNLLEVLPLVRHFRNSGCVLRFIEYMDVGTMNGWQAAEVVSAGDLIELIGSEFPLEQLPRIGSSDVAERWALRDGTLELGFITSVSEPFCGQCTRARLSADGKLFTCLFAHGGHDLLQVLRQGDDVALLTRTINAIWSARTDRYSEQRSEMARPLPKAEMYHLGG